MDAIERITQRIRDDAEEQARQIRLRAEQDALDITARYAAIAKQESERILAAGRQIADERWSGASWSFPPSSSCWTRRSPAHWIS